MTRSSTHSTIARAARRSSWWSRARAGSLLGVTLAMSGCAGPAGVVFEDSGAGPSWPTPPDPPRIRYVGQLRSEGDLKPAQSGLDRLGEALFGKKPVQGMISPMGVCTDGAQRVFIADSGGQCVHVLDLGSRRTSRWAPTEATQRLMQPVAIAFDPAGTGGRVLVSDAQAGYIAVFSLDGSVTGALGRGVLRRPCGLAVEATTGRVFVADAAAHQIVVLDAQGAELQRLGTRGSGPAQFNYPTNVALDRAGNLYVSDSLNFRVQVFDAQLEHLRSLGRKGDLPGYFAQPKGLALDSQGHLYVVDAHFEAVQLFDAQGQLLMSFGREGRGPGEFWLPAGVFIDPADRVWIADSQNKRVQVFDFLPEGKRP